jgi:hypothetical protein
VRIACTSSPWTCQQRARTGHAGVLLVSSCSYDVQHACTHVTCPEESALIFATASHIWVYRRYTVPCSNHEAKFPQSCGSVGPCHSSGGWSLASHRGGPSSTPASGHMRFVVDSGTGASFLWVLWFLTPANSHSTDCSTLIIIRDWYNWPNNGRCTTHQDTKILSVHSL